MGDIVFKKIDIERFENLYEISNTGIIRSIKTGLIKKFQENKPNGYLWCQLFNNNKRRSVYMHRMIAIYFIPNPENKPQVNHKNCIKQDNRIENLEWMTNGENLKHAYENGMRNGSSLRKKVINTKTLYIHNSIYSASKETIYSAEHISRMLSGKSKNKTDFKFYEE